MFSILNGGVARIGLWNGDELYCYLVARLSTKIP